MVRSISAILGGMAFGLIIATCFGLMMGTMYSFTGFSHAVRPGSKCDLFVKSVSTGTAWAKVASLIAVPVGAIFMWRNAERLPQG
jgi:hypothetical protein